MEEITDIVNSDIKTNSEDSDSFENSIKTDIGEKNFFVNSDEKTDNEETKNQGQQSGESRGCQDLKKHLTEEQPKKGKSSKEGSHAVESMVEEHKKRENRIMKI